MKSSIPSLIISISGGLTNEHNARETARRNAPASHIDPSPTISGLRNFLSSSSVGFDFSASQYSSSAIRPYKTAQVSGY